MLTGKKTKIVATIGPVTENEKTLKELVESGLNVVRLNFSHGSYEEHKKRIDLTRKVSESLNTPIAVLQDLSGPKIRIGDFETESVLLEKGKTITLTTDEVIGTKEKVSVNYPDLPKEVKKGEVIFLNDGKQKLKVEDITEKEIVCKILIGGEIKGRRGLNFPDSKLSISSLTEKDWKDVDFGIENDVDFMAISFVRNPSDITELKNYLKKKDSNISIIAKIETREAIENIDEIISKSDGVMVARGDLAVEISAEEVPITQKMIIKKCNQLGKPVITATQLLYSMTHSPTPTRAEVNDIANAILDGTDAVMLSEETTIGSHPVDAVKTMTQVALYTERFFPYEDVLEHHHLLQKNVTSSVSYSVVNTAHDIDARAIIALSVSGFTARMISRYKPARPVLVITPERKTYNRLSLSFNCYPFLAEHFNGVTNTIEKSKEIALKSKIVKQGDEVIISAGIPFSQPGNTNLLLVQRI